MRIDLPCCGFKNCRYSFDGNCMKPSEQGKCEYWYLLHKELYKPEPHWIPCNERLPENYERVLTTISISNREPKVRSGYYHNGLFSNDNGDCWNSTDPEVKGWCKLPEPYKPESED